MLAVSPAHAATEGIRPWPEGIPSGAELEAAGAVIGEIRVTVGDIFDPSIPSEDKWLYRTANKLHINTREPIIRRQLLFKSGESYVDRLVKETERILRANDYLYDAWIRPIAYDGKTVDLEVHTRDTWTLNPGINFSRQGGANSGSVELQEKNLLGNGQRLSFGWSNDVDREAVNFELYEPHFRSTWIQLGVLYSDADDGDTKALRVDRPFYSLDARRAAGVNLFDSIRNDPRYAYGEQVGEFEHDEQFVEVYGGRSAGWRDGWVRRWKAGAAYQRSRYAVTPDEPLGGPLPEDIELAYPWLGFDLVEDVYQERVNQDQIARTEDVLLGLRAGARIGYAAESLGSDRNALLLSAYAQNGWDFGRERSLFVTSVASGRVEDEGLRNGIVSAEARYYARTSENTKFFATVNGSLAEDLDADQQLLLGGGRGCVGIPCATRPVPHAHC
jgi:hypothetical protein